MVVAVDRTGAEVAGGTAAGGGEFDVAGSVSSAASTPTAALTRVAESVTAARRSTRDAKGSHTGRARHAALIVRTKAFTGHAPRTEIVGTARKNPSIAGGDIAIDRRYEERIDRGVGGEGVRLNGRRG